ncbi:phosphate ABC transporter substrate-binding protein PstS [Oscillatoria salina]|uniref:phosphate ABC transporter substrate-binding protein PstS n=1 Tax=Oscillatoria salina TaxID=331517 RepID=UPI0013B8EF0E|nr:phosphate ABC transporter substrate-binding protein PstS [Oscillatoria salina]MBZ8180445.1 phosphate ABC transporter substrate-binding protein PstS [Oscillatoria salina IIICB1]NET89461.1 phosphate ABC transporter substrate-binding protein PstS [Kamptonema sp. SIO1D9]
MIFLTTTLRRAVAVSVAAVTVSLTSGAVNYSEVVSEEEFFTAQANITLNGAGASFPKPLYDRYFNEIRQKKGLRVNYEAIGSGGGIKQFIADTVDFAGSDAPPEQGEKSQMKKGMVMVPTAGGAVAVVYNLPGVSNLKLSRETLPAIFEGKITRWNDSRISADNPGVNLPNKPIRVAVRSDGSGTTYIFTSHLNAIGSSIAADKAPSWPGTTLGGAKNAGVAAVVQQNEGAIGYVQADYAFENNLNMAAVENKAGQYLKPTDANADKALENIRFNPDFTTANSDDPEDGYPIVGVTWLLLKEEYENVAKERAIEEMVEWILTDGQNINGQLHYTRIPQSVAQRAINTMKQEVSARP